ERAPYVSLVCGSASYNKLPSMLAQLEAASAGTREIPRPAGENAGLRDDASVVAEAGKSGSRKPEAENLIRITGLDDRETDACLETEFTARTNPHRGYITIIEGCDKFCAYCVVPYTRGKERSRTSSSVLDEARQLVDLGYTEIQLLGQNVNSYRDPDGKKSYAELLAAVASVAGMRRVRF